MTDDPDDATDKLDYAYATRIVEIIENLIEAKMSGWDSTEDDKANNLEVAEARQELVNILEELFHG